MKIKVFIFFFLIPLITYANSSEFNRYFINASGTAKPSVVNISAYEKKGRDTGGKLVRVSYGTGTVISKHGFIVTNYHVVKKGDFFRAVCSDGKTYEMQLFDNGRYYISDNKTDIAVLKLDNRDGTVFTPIKFGDSNLLNEGEWVLAIGNPYGLKQSITAGIVSSKGRDNIGFTDIEDFIQTDVSINPGNSGGPLINLKGEMVGINTAIRSGSGGFQGISFAIPSNIVRQVCTELTEFGRVRRGWLGLIARERDFSHNSDKKIVEIVSVIRNSPSDTAGIRQGDVIKEIAGKKIESLGALTKLIGNMSIGSKLHITVSRKGKINDIILILREKDEYERMRNDLYYLFRSYGIEVDEDSISGRIVVSYISPGSPYREMEQGDIRISVNSRKTESIDEFLEQFRRSGRKIDTVEVMRDSGIYELNFRSIDSVYD
jgi:S1-C subfamily serine protease